MSHRRSAQQPETHPDFYVGDDLFGFGFIFDFVVRVPAFGVIHVAALLVFLHYLQRH